MKEQISPNNVVKFPFQKIPVQQQVKLENVEVSTPNADKIIAKASKLDALSEYPCNFNYEVYRDIERRYHGKFVRGGLVCKTDLKLANYHPSCFKCHYTFELDTYGRGCIHDCVYCYAKDELSLHGYWNNPMPMPIDLNEIRSAFYTVFETTKRSKWRSILESRVPIRLGSMSDSFMWSDLKYGVTLEVLKLLKHYKYPYIVFTRSDLVAHDRYLEVMDADICSVQMSICGSDDKLTKILEPGAPSNERRMKALKKVSEAGILTAVRINPLFPTYPDGYFSDRESVIKRFGTESKIPKFSFFDIDQVDAFMERLAENNVRTVLAGMVRLKSSSLNLMKRSAGIDLIPFYRPEVAVTGLRGNREKKFSDPEVRAYYVRTYLAAKKAGLRFSTCYIGGNGTKDYFDHQDLWSNKADCCDVKGHLSSFKNTSQQIPWSERARHTPNKKMAYDSEKTEYAIDQKYQSASSNSEVIAPFNGNA